MFSTAEKTKNVNVQRQHQQPGNTFFRKAGEESFFGSTESQSFFSPTIQAKLSVSSPDDPQEKEADAVAEQVMRMPEPVASSPSKEEEKLQKKEEEQENVQAKYESTTITVQRKCEACEKEEKAQAKLFRMIQRSEEVSSSFADAASAESSSEYNINRKELSLYHSDVIQRSGRGPPAGYMQGSFEQNLSSSKGAGSSLPSNTKQFMESRFNADFSGVRIHTGSYAEGLSSHIHAQAFTHGNDIYFNSGKYSPHTETGGTLLAHELTHTIQQGASNTIQRKAAPTQTTLPPAEITSLATGVFTPSNLVTKYIEEGNNSGNPVNVSFGNYAAGIIKVRKAKDGFKTTEAAQGVPLHLPFLQPLVNAGIQPMLAIKIADSKISGYLTIAIGKSQQQVGSSASLFEWIKKNPLLMKWSGLENLAANKNNIINEINGDKIHFEVKDIKVKLGGFVNGSFNIGLFNSDVAVEGNAVVSVKSLANGSLYFKRDEMGDLKGSFEMQAQVKNFTGAVKGEFLNGIFDIHGKLHYNTEKLDGEVDIIVTDPKQAKGLVLQQLEPQQISKEAEERAGVNNSVTGPQPGPRAIAGWGTLNFAFNKWLTGMAKVIVDADGYITVHGEITPPAEVKLFDSKPYRSPNFIDIHPTLRWGIPYVADLHVGLDFLLYAEAQVGPAFLRNIKIIGNYSTDLLLYNDFRVQGTFNLMGYAGLVFTFGAHAGVGILGFDIDLNGTLSATAGIKGYVEATPVIGYREVADPVAGKKGEFFISGQAELAAQPFLGLKGSIGLSVDSPWPIPNFGRSWPMFEKEYPLPGQFGIGLTFGEYILGSGEWPNVDFNKVNFDPDKFKDDLIEKNIPPKQQRSDEKKTGFADKMQGQEPAPPPPAPAIAHKKPSSKPEKPVTKEVLERWGNGMKAVRALKDKRDEKPVPKATLVSDLNAVRRKFRFNVLAADPAGQNWSVYAEMPGINNADAPIGIKGLPEEKKEEKQAEKKESAAPESEAQISLDSAIAEVELLLTKEDVSEENLISKLPEIKKQHKLAELKLVIDTKGTDEDVVHVHGEINPKKDTGKVKKKKKNCDEPGTSAAGIGNISRHGSQGSSLRKGPEIHWIESEHVLPFATGRTLWEALSLILPIRGSMVDRAQTTIMIYYGAARIKTPPDNTMSATLSQLIKNSGLAKTFQTSSVMHEDVNRGSHNNGTQMLETQVSELLHTLLASVESAKENAVTRTKSAINKEHVAVAGGCTKTNGERRNETKAKPTPDQVEQAASQQYNDVVNLITHELHSVIDEI